MERFLANLYREEQEKTAAAELENFLAQQPLEELEAFLGLTKKAASADEALGAVKEWAQKKMKHPLSSPFSKERRDMLKEKKAVAEPGGAEAQLPDSKPGRALDAKMKAIDEYSAKARLETPPTREQAETAGKVNYDGPSVAAKEVEKKGSMIWADRMGKKLAAACMGKETEFTTPEAKQKAGVMAKAMKAGDGKPEAQRKQLVSAVASNMKKQGGAPISEYEDEPGYDPGYDRAIQLGGVKGMLAGGLGGMGVGAGLGALLGRRYGLAGPGAALGTSLGSIGVPIGAAIGGHRAAKRYMAGKGKQSQGVGDSAGMGLSGQGAGQGIESLGGLGDTGVGTDKTTIAHVKAKLAARAFHSTRGAPDHIRKIAAAMTGVQIAKLAGISQAEPPSPLEAAAMQAQQAKLESTPRQMLAGGIPFGLLGGLAGAGMAGHLGGAIPGALAGGALGAGIGAFGAHRARQHHAALRAATEGGEITPAMAGALETQRKGESVPRRGIIHGILGGIGGASLGNVVGADYGHPGLGAGIGALGGAGLGALSGIMAARKQQQRRMALTGGGAEDGGAPVAMPSE